MATQCTVCRTVNSEDDAPHCVTCGSILHEQDLSSGGTLKTLVFCLVIGLLLTHFVVHHQC
jgi:uncharacterized paraquat-inducible protein A